MMALRMQKGEVFKSYDEFEKALDQYCAANKCIFVKQATKTIEGSNKTIKTENKRYPECWKYRSALFKCKHFGNYQTRSKGKRPVQHSFKTGCEALIRIVSNKFVNGLVITHANLEHSNHRVLNSEHDTKVIPQYRKLTDDALVDCRDLIILNVPPRKIVEHIKSKYGVQMRSYDIHNHKCKMRQLYSGKDWREAWKQERDEFIRKMRMRETNGLPVSGNETQSLPTSGSETQSILKSESVTQSLPTSGSETQSILTTGPMSRSLEALVEKGSLIQSIQIPKGASLNQLLQSLETNGSVPQILLISGSDFHSFRTSGSFDPASGSEIQSSSTSGSETQSLPASGSETQSLPTSGSETQSLPTSGSETQSFPASGSETQSLPSSGSETQSLPTSGCETQSFPASGSETQSLPSSGSETQSLPTSGSETQSLPSSGSETQSLPSSGSETQSLPTTGSETQSLPASGSETQSLPASGCASNVRESIRDNQVSPKNNFVNARTEGSVSVKIELDAEEPVSQRLSASDVEVERSSSLDDLAEYKPAVSSPQHINGRPCSIRKRQPPASSPVGPISKMSRIDTASIIAQINKRVNSSSDAIRKLTHNLEADSDDNIFLFISRKFPSFSKSTQNWLEDEAMRLYSEAKRRDQNRVGNQHVPP